MKYTSVSEINDRIQEVEGQIEKLENLREKLINERQSMERKFGNGGECPECGAENARFNRGFGRGYTIECIDCGFTIHGSD